MSNILEALGKIIEAEVNRRLIEQGKPKVNRELVERWANKIDNDYGDFTTHLDPTVDNLFAMFRELGFEVEG